MNKIKIAVQMDEPEALDKEADSTLAIIEEALKRNFEVNIYTVDELSLDDNIPVAFCREVVNLDIKNEKFLELSNSKKKLLSSFNAVLIRQDPPYNMKYLTSTYILEKVSSKTIILNDPLSIRNSPEKLLVTNFYNLMPPTLITKNKHEISRFFEEHNSCIIKPLYGNGGKSVFYTTSQDPNLDVIIEKFVDENEHFIIQKFVKNVSKGDKRILLIDGEPVGAINRVPGEKKIRANIHIGGKAKKSKITKNDLKICSAIKKTLRSRGLFFAGIDIIDNHLTEINVTSPTCIREIDYFNKDNIAGKFWDVFENKYLH